MIDDLPVSVALPAPLDADVAAWVESDLGWQVVDPDGSLAPVLALADRAVGGVPWVAIVDGTPDEDAVTSRLLAGAEDVIGWPRDRDRIPLIATRVDVHRRLAPTGARVEVGGVAGGVGTSTIALAAAGLLAWGGAAVLVVGSDALLRLAGVSGSRAAAGARIPVAGIPQLSVTGRHADVTATAWTGDVVVVDAGTRITATTTLLVARPDGGLQRARHVARPVIVNGDLPFAPTDARRVLGRHPLAHLPWSARVARAGAAGHIPGGLPGRWLRDLGTGLRRLGEWAA